MNKTIVLQDSKGNEYGVQTNKIEVVNSITNEVARPLGSVLYAQGKFYVSTDRGWVSITTETEFERVYILEQLVQQIDRQLRDVNAQLDKLITIGGRPNSHTKLWIDKD